MLQKNNSLCEKIYLYKISALVIVLRYYFGDLDVDTKRTIKTERREVRR
jgi:hypothetical protein